MNNYSEIYGLEIRKDVFDVYDSETGHNLIKNDGKGFVSFKKGLSKNVLIVMDTTGYYHYKSAQFLCKVGLRVSVVNPLSVWQFIQMKLAKVKTEMTHPSYTMTYSLKS